MKNGDFWKQKGIVIGKMQFSIIFSMDMESFCKIRVKEDTGYMFIKWCKLHKKRQVSW